MSALQSNINHLVARYGVPEYSADLITELISLCGAARTVYTDVALTDDETAIAAGATPILFTSSWWWFRYISEAEGYDTSAVSVDAINRGIADTGSGTGPMVIDIEEWSPITEFDEMVANLSLAASMWRDQTDKEIGFYRIIPDVVGFYEYPIYLKRAIDASDKVAEDIWRSRISTCMKLGAKTEAALGQYVDFLAPQCYVPYHVATDTDLAEWKWSAAFQILEATRLARGKPVYPFVWFRATAEAGESLLTSAEYTAALQWVAAFPGVSGVIAWPEAPLPTVPVNGYVWTDVIATLTQATGPFAEA